MNNLKLIAAVGRNGELGLNGGLIWTIKEDLAFFKTVTWGHYIVMGRRTFEGLPKSLPGRRYIVIGKGNRGAENVVFFETVNEFLQFAKSIDDDIWVIGGGMIYTALLPYCSKMILTEIDAECKQADVYFPKFNLRDWNVKEAGGYSADGISYSRVEYIRREE